MSDRCCHNKAEDIKDLVESQAKILWTILIINMVMFFVESFYGVVAESTALIGDSLDMLGDALAYGSSIYVVRKGLSAKLKASEFKAYLMIGLGLAVLIRAVYRSVFQVLPEVGVMTIVGVIALFANIVCLVLLNRHKDDDINFTSVWICSRNDIIANSSVLVAAFLVFYFQSSWPDLVVGLGITVLFLNSAFGILRDVKRQRQSAC